MKNKTHRNPMQRPYTQQETDDILSLSRRTEILLCSVDQLINMYRMYSLNPTQQDISLIQSITELAESVLPQLDKLIIMTRNDTRNPKRDENLTKYMKQYAKITKQIKKYYEK